MAKKRKVSRRTEPTGPREADDKDARLTIRTYEDVADEHDEYWANKDRINFDSDDEPRAKRARQEEDFLEASDEEILGQDESDEEEEEVPAKHGMKTAVQDSADEQQEGENEEGDEGWWGSNKEEYYDADQIETEGDALEEEAEAKRLRAKRSKTAKKAELTKDEWAAPQEEAREDREVVTEVLKEMEVTDDMGPEERYNLLKSRYPEFDFLVDRFNQLQPLLATLQREAQGKPAKSLEVVKSWVLGCYVAALASYFAVMMSPSRDGDGSASTLTPLELREHEVMETLAECEEAWEKVSQFKLAKNASQLGMLSPPDEENMEMDVDIPVRKTKTKLSKVEIKAKKEREGEKARRAKAMEEALGDLSTMLKGTNKSSKEARAAAVKTDTDDDHSDFGEEDVLDERTAADKAKRKKSLKFYTSQIVQKSNKRAGAGRDAGGDMDIPYRERLRDRQARLNAEAERRGKKDSKFGAELGDGDSDGEDAMAKGIRDDEDEYYDMVAQQSRKKHDDKAARKEALAQAKKDERVVEESRIGEDGKRQITYQIQKNKGLTPHRRKEVRNPRVKKRMMFEAKKKKLRSVKAVYKGGEGKGGYQGELSGIKTSIIKSTKL